MTAINSNRAIRGPVTAVPVVAGKGVRLVADTENNRWVVEADETVLWEGTATNDDTALSETANNFERIRIYFNNDGSIHNSVEVIVTGSSQYITLVAGTVYASSQYFKYGSCILDGTSLKKGSTSSATIYKSGTGTGNAQAGYETFNLFWYKVVGINRIASN